MTKSIDNDSNQFDIVIVGSGIVGAIAALALAQNTQLRIALIEAKLNPLTDRYSAISLATQKTLQRIGVWEKISENSISPYDKMFVWDNASEGKVTFDRTHIAAPALGYIIADELIRSHLIQSFEYHENLHFFYPLQLKSIHRSQDQLILSAEDKQTINTRLLIAADGANSWVRSQLNIPLHQKDYEQVAIVATVGTEYSHAQTAYQRFLTSGPLAFLPLTDPHTASIVWSCSPEKAGDLLKLSDTAFCQNLAEAFDYKLGNIEQVSARQNFKLIRRHAKNYVQQNVALIGDAAHTIHPLAGQGLNLGVSDAIYLAETISHACQQNRTFYSFDTLRKYERHRKSDNLAMMAIVGTFKTVFAANTLAHLCSFGLNFVDKYPFLKKLFINYSEQTL